MRARLSLLCFVVCVGCSSSVTGSGSSELDVGLGQDVSAVAPFAPGEDRDIPTPDSDSSGDSSAVDIFDGGDLPSGPWRSVLYPEDWSPSWTSPDGQFFHDFSYAGYRYGVDLSEGQPSTTVLNVSDFGASGDGQSDATASIQAAIDAALLTVPGSGRVTVFFPAGLYRVDGRLFVRDSDIVLAGEGHERSRLHFTLAAGMSHSAHLTFAGTLTHEDPIPLARDGISREDFVEVADATALQIGDDIAIGWVITDDFVADHGMEGIWSAFNGTWQPFFRREIVAIDKLALPMKVYVDVPLRYPARVRDLASLRVERGHLRECGVESLGFANAVGWEQAWDQAQVHVIAMEGVKDCWINEVGSFVSPSAPVDGPGSGAHLQSSGILIRHAKRVTVSNSAMSHAQNRGPGGNGYLFEVRQSNELLFRDLEGRAGRHNFIQNWGFGTSGVVWLRIHSSEGKSYPNRTSTLFTTGHSEFHHSLAMANLIDSSVMNDGWSAINRRQESSGSGHTATETVLWNTGGAGTLRSYQYGHGYVIGTSPSLTVQTALPDLESRQLELLEPLSPWGGTQPLDHTEGLGLGQDLIPASLYEDQLRRRQRF